LRQKIGIPMSGCRKFMESDARHHIFLGLEDVCLGTVLRGCGVFAVNGLVDMPVLRDGGCGASLGSDG